MRRKGEEEVGLEREGELYCVTLDGLRVHTPKGHLLGHRSKVLMEAVVEEWGGREEGLCGLLHSLWDGVGEDGEGWVLEGLKILETDLVLYRAGREEEGGRLRVEQDRLWGEYVSLFEKDLGVKLKVWEGVMYAKQEGSTMEGVAKRLRGLLCDDLLVWGLGAVRSGSLVLGYGLWRGAGVDEIVSCCTVEERVNGDRWGEEEEELKRREELRLEIGAIARYRDLVERK